MKKITIIIVALGLLAACNKQSDDMAVLQPDQNNSTQGMKHARTFEATINAAADPNAPLTGCTGGFAAPDFFLSGNADHMGLLNAQTSRFHHESCDLNVTTMLVTTNVSVDLVSHTGDLIHCTGDDTVNVANFLVNGIPTGTITGTWTINGGTGKFTGATGSVDINGLVDFATNSFSCDVVGTVNY